MVMKNSLLFAAVAASLVLSSCYVDPYYGGSASYSGTYNSGYGSYGGGGYSSSVFISTGDPRWSYDPYRYCYYDRYRGSYYDPYLYGYYPVGYLPVPVRGVPHPHNWHGSGYCPPPSIVKVHNLDHYDDRVRNYSNTKNNWSRQVSGGGSSSWMNASQRSQLHDRASQNLQKPPTKPTQGSSWNDGGYKPSGQSGQPNRYPGSSSMNQSGNGPNWGGQQYQNPGKQPSGNRYTPQTPVTNKPDINPRNTNGGIFEGVDRGARNNAPNQQKLSPQERRSLSHTTEAPRTREPRVEPAPKQKKDNDEANELKKSSGRGSGGFLR